jgi:hypothetical protein
MLGSVAAASIAPWAMQSAPTRNLPKEVSEPPAMSSGNPIYSIAVISPEDFARTNDEVEDAFVELLGQWRSDTRVSSNQVRTLMHTAHFKIIGLGPQVLPHIFADLANGGGPWFVALESITHTNPIPPDHRKSAKLMRSDWITWAKEHGYLRTRSVNRSRFPGGSLGGLQTD